MPAGPRGRPGDQGPHPHVVRRRRGAVRLDHGRASGYILKEVNAQDLLGAVRHVVAGHSLIDPLPIERVLDRVRNGPETAPELANLTEQELRLLELIAEGSTNRQIGERMFLAEKTVKNYVSTLLGKLGLDAVPRRRCWPRASCRTSPTSEINAPRAPTR